MNIFLSISLIVLSLSLLIFPAETANKPVVIAYVFCENDLLDGKAIAAENLTHINYAFADIREGRMVEGFKRDAENFAVLNSLKKRNPDLRIMVSVGGWTWSGNFSDMVLTAASRKVFIDSAMAFLERYDLDGLDVDWEYPGLSGYGNIFRPEDKENFSLFLDECRQRLNELGKKKCKYLLLTAAVGASEEFIEHTEMAKVGKYLDLVNLMTYDFSEAEVDPITTHHSCLYTNPAAPKTQSVDTMTTAFIKAGVPAAKLVVGVPFYGHTWGTVEKRNQGLFQPGKVADKHYDTSYAGIAKTLLPGGDFIRCWDPIAHAPFLWNEKEAVFVSYDDPQSIAEKCQFIKAKGLRGMMFWAYGEDGGLLLAVMAKQLLKISL